MTNLVPIERIENRILLIRGQKVMIDRDLAELYEVTTKALNQAVKRNSERFPDEFIFQLSKAEKHELVTNCDHLRDLKFSYNLPYAFTEHGVAMLSCVLKSERAVKINILIIKAFVRLRQLLSAHKELAQKITELEGRVGRHDIHIAHIIEAIKKILEQKPKKPVEERPGKRMGFLCD